jgi:hypothetical protein
MEASPLFDENDLKRALAAFRKKLKAMQLEQDSKLTRSHVTGKRETITAMQPPLGFGKAVWEELAKRGELKYDGGGFYQLGERKG